MASGHEWLALVAYLGGLSAATAMIIVATVALSTMISNDLVMPVLLRLRVPGAQPAPRPAAADPDHPPRRPSCSCCCWATSSSGWSASHLPPGQHRPDLLLRRRPVRAGRSWPASTGSEANLAGAMAGLRGGVAVWLYTLVLPTLATAGLVDAGFVERRARSGSSCCARRRCSASPASTRSATRVVWSLGRQPHAWSCCAGLLGRQSSLERCRRCCSSMSTSEQAPGELVARRGQGRGAARAADPFPGPATRRHGLRRSDLRRRGRVLAPDAAADATLVQLAERQLARAIGSASARVMVGSVVRGEVIGPDDLMQILDETSQAIEYSQTAGAEVGSARAGHGRAARGQRPPAPARPAQGRLPRHGQPRAAHAPDLDPLVLRDPARHARPRARGARQLPADHRARIRAADPADQRFPRPVQDRVGQDGVAGRRVRAAGHRRRRRAATHGLFAERARRGSIQDLGPASAARAVRPRPHGPGGDQPALQRRQVRAGRAGPGAGRAARSGRTATWFGSRTMARACRSPTARRSSRSSARSAAAALLKDKPKGTGLGLAICRQIVEHFGGRIWAEDAALGGAAICFTLPVALRETKAAA